MSPGVIKFVCNAAASGLLALCRRSVAKHRHRGMERCVMLDLKRLSPSSCNQFSGAGVRRCHNARVGLNPCKYDERSQACERDVTRQCHGFPVRRPLPSGPPPNASREPIVRFTRMPYGVLTTWPEHAMPSASLRTTDRLIITCHRAPADIPKTGGTSLHTALRNAQYDVPGSHRGQERCFHAPGLCGEPDCVRPCSYSRYGLTRCHAVAKNRSVVNLVMLRSPRRHVASQYYECRYSLWGRLTTGVQCNLRTGECAGPMSKSSNFSALFVRDMSFYSGLHAWVAHYASNLSRPVPEYGCYNPRNMQSRALTCQQPDIFASHVQRRGDRSGRENRRARRHRAVRGVTLCAALHRPRHAAVALRMRRQKRRSDRH